MGWSIISKLNEYRKVRGSQEALLIVANVEATQREVAICLAAHNGLHVDDGQVLEEVIGSVVEHRAHGILRLAHDSLQNRRPRPGSGCVDALGGRRFQPRMFLL